MYKNILVALDGSPTSNLAIREAIKIANRGSKIIAITVVENPLIGYKPPVVAYEFAVLHDEFLQHSKNILDKARRYIQRHLQNAHIETHVVNWNPRCGDNIAHSIEAAAQKYQADLIVVGTHGRSGAKRFFLGSIAEQVLRQSQLPVLIIRDQSLIPKTS